MISLWGGLIIAVYQNSFAMDILEQYEKNLPQEPHQAPQWESSDEYAWSTRFLMRYSGGKIQNEKQASHILMGFVAVAIIFLLFLFFSNGLIQQKPTATSIEQMKQFMNTVPLNSH